MPNKRKILNLGLFMLIIMNLTACNTVKGHTKENQVNNEVISSNEINNGYELEELDIEKIKNTYLKQKISMHMNNNGVYSFNDKSKKEIYFFFNGIGNVYSNFKFDMNKEILTISYKSATEKGINKQSLFDLKSTNKLDPNLTIILKNNGQESSFDNIN
ncbi:hypothetical protein [Gottfriedia acidiceleris]|uniref:hypothetical protein n=1 Tax=Gottfriedia acidiceleris TaxID=371036 RepID=UPI002FFE4C0F